MKIVCICNLKVLLAALIVLSATSAHAQINPTQWKEDLDFLEQTIKTKHLDSFENITEEEFTKEVTQLRSRIDTLEDFEVSLEMVRIVGTIGWGHTRLSLPVNGDHLGFYQGHSGTSSDSRISSFSVLPIRFFLFKDGLFVQSASEDYKNYIGYKVIAFGPVSVTEVLDRVRPYMSVENESAFRLQAPIRLSIIELLYTLRLTNSLKRISLTLENEGISKEITVEPIGFDQNPKWFDIHSLKSITKPLWLTGTHSGMWDLVDSKHFWDSEKQYYWSTFLEDGKIQYVKINHLDDPYGGIPVAGFMKQTIDSAIYNNADKIVIDLRHNMGGSNDVNRSILLALARWEKSKYYGNVFAIIGRHTYSAAIMLAQMLEENIQVAFIGEETGGKPANIGDSRKFRLPNSQLTLRVSTLRHHDWVRTDRPSIYIHYPIPFYSQEYFTGIDPVLNWIRSNPIQGLSDVLFDVYVNAGFRSMRNILNKYLSDPDTYTVDFEDAALKVADYILNIKNNNQRAQWMYQYILWYYPESRNSIIGYILSSHRLEDSSAAQEGIEYLEKLYPNDPEIARLQRLLKD